MAYMSNAAASTVIEPQDRRESKRLLFYRGEFPLAILEFAQRTYEAEVYDLSTSGVGLIPKEEIPGLDSINQIVRISLGNSRPRKARLQNVGHVKFSGAVRLKLGFKLDALETNQRLSHGKLHCRGSMPLAYCEDPIAFNRTLHFNVIHFSENGIGLRTRAESEALYPGLQLELRILMPARGEFTVVAEVVSTKRDHSFVEADCLMFNPGQQFRNSITEFLLMTNPDLNIQDLKKKGFSISDLERAFLFRCVQSPSQFDEILRLRLKASQKDGRWVGETDIEKMRDAWDKHARQIFCEVNSRIVAAARIVFNNGLSERSEHLSYGAQIPDWLWKAGFVEGSRVCTDPEFRGADVFVHVIQHMSRIVTQSGHRYLVLNCVDSLVPVYKKTAGVFSLDQRFYTKFMQDRALNLLCVDIRALQVGLNWLPTTWVLHAPVGSYLVSTGSLKLRWWEKVLRYLFTGLHRLVVWANRRKRLTLTRKPKVPLERPQRERVTQ